MPSMSSAERWWPCPGSEALPRSKTEPAQQTQDGTAIHKFLEDVCRLGRDEALGRVEDDRHREMCEMIDVDRLPVDGGQFAAEVALAYNVADDSARELGRSIGRDYTSVDRTCEIPGTADVVAVAPDHVYVGDYKTGWAPVTDAERNPQLALLALAACRAYGRTEARVEVIRINKESGVPYRDAADLSLLDIDMIADRARRGFERVQMAQRDDLDVGSKYIRQGPWCKYCPAYAACPEKTALIRRLADGTELEDLYDIEIVSHEQAASAYHRLKVARELLDRIESHVYAYAKQEGPISLGEGRYLGEFTKPGREMIDGDVAYDVLEADRGTAVARKATKATATKADIRRALKEVLREGEKITHVERDVLRAIRDAGGARKTDSTKVREFTEKDLKKSLKEKTA